MASVSLTRGALVRDITAFDTGPRPVPHQLSDFRGRRNLVLVFPPAGALLAELAKANDELREEEAVVLTVPEDDLRARELYGITRSAIFITDRYGEIFFASEQPPAISEIMDWLRFINAQCPE